jgi:RND family efflux transporter MFP subunit
MTSIPRTMILGPAFALAATLALGGCKAKKTDATTETAAEPVVAVRQENLAIVADTELRSGPVISGSLEAERQATVRAEVAGAVTAMLVDAGQRVKRDQLIGRLDDTAVRDAYLSARSAVRTAEAALENARRNADRANRLSEAGALPARDLENARWAVTNAESGLADAQARLASSEKQVNHTTLRAPFDGVLSDRPADPGDVVQLGTPLFTVVDPRGLRLEATVPAEQIGRLRIGMPVEFTVAGFTRRFNGRIERINPVVDPTTRQVRIYVTVPNQEQTLVAGLFAEGRVATESARAAAIPIAAIDNRGTAPIVRRIRQGRIVETPVTLGVRDEGAELVEIRSGLAAGDTVLVGTTQAVTPGAKIRILGEEITR